MRGAQLIGLLIALASPWSAYGQVDGELPTPPRPRRAPPRLVLAEPERPPAITEDRLRAHLEVRAAALRNKDTAGAELALGLLEEARDALGAPNVILAAVVLVEEAQAAREAGLLAAALDLTGRALRLAPDLLAAHWLEINLLIEQDSTRVARIWHAVSDLARAWLRGFRNRIHLLTLLSAAVLLGLTATVVVFGLVLLARHLRFQAHDLSVGLPKVVGGGEMSLLLLLVVLLPGAVGLGWPASVALGLGLTLAYQSTSERVLAVLGIALVSASPWIAGWAAPLVAFHGSRVDHLARVMEEAFAEPAEQALATHLRQNPTDHLAALVLGVRAARRSDLVEARRLLTIAAASPSDPIGLNDLGVVEYRLGEHEAAEQHLRAAADIDDRSEPHLNLSLIASERGDFESAQVHLTRARELDGDLVEQIISKAGLPTESRLSLISVDQERLWAQLYALDRAEVGVTRAQLWRLVGGRVREWSIPAWGLLALAVGLLGFRARDPSGPCTKCGSPAEASAPSGHCTQCQSVFIGANAISPAAREHKARQVRGYQFRLRWTERIASIVPGLGALGAGRTVVGILQFAAFACLVAFAGLRGGLALHAWHVPGDGSGGWLVVVVVAFLALGLAAFSVQRAFRR